MLPEIRVLLERAAARRESLLGLLTVLPADYWQRAEPGGWTIQQQLAHLTSTEAILASLLQSAQNGATRLWLAETEDPATLLNLREAAVTPALERDPGTLLNEAAATRSALESHLAQLTPAHLETAIQIAGAVDRWGQPLQWSLREYLAIWTTHDADHEAAIRSAMTTPPDLSTVALTQRKRRA